MAAMEAFSSITLKFIDIEYRIKLKGRRKDEEHEKTILNGITGKVNPGEVLAILGPSGSGKSTLLNILGGRIQKHGGSVAVNGRRRLGKSLQKKIGFVAQEDVLYPHLTVRETLIFCALLRLPAGLPSAEKVKAAEEVMAELGLTKCEKSLVREVSGGERKRVSIGHEMLINPSLLILDEPTSGLDSTAAMRVAATMSGLARKGKTVVASVHQPSSRVYQMFQKVLLLAEGRCLYFGPGREAMEYFASLGFSPRFLVNPADFMLDLCNGIAPGEETDRTSVKQTLISSYTELIEPTLKSDRETDTSLSSPDSPDHPQNPNWLSQFSILLRRNLRERRHESFNALKITQVLAAALLSGALWWRSNPNHVRDRLGLLFFVTIFWGVFPSFNAVFSFPQDRSILLKERSSGMYSLSSYFLARTASDLPMELALPFLFISITYWMANLRHEFSAFLQTLMAILGYVLVAQGLGLALGAAIMDAKKASTVITVIMLAFLITGGFYVQNIPVSLSWLKYCSYSFYCYRILVGIQYGGREVGFLMGSDREVTVIFSIGALVGMLLGFRILAYVALRRMKV